MTSQQNERHLHVKVPQMMKQDLEAKAAKLGVSEATLVRAALKAQGYGVRWSAPPPAAISEERPAVASFRPGDLPDPLAVAGAKFVGPPGVPQKSYRGSFETRQRASRAQMQPEA